MCPIYLKMERVKLLTLEKWIINNDYTNRLYYGTVYGTPYVRLRQLLSPALIDSQFLLKNSIIREK